MTNNNTINLLINSLPFLLKGAEVTVILSVVSLALAMCISIVIALGRHLRVPVLKQVGDIYVSIFRGTPLLVQLFVIYYGLPQLGLAMGPIASGIIGLTLNTGAYLAESFRSALESVPYGQYECGYSVGLTRIQLMRYVVLPQSIRTALPTIGNTFINLVKDTSLVSVITVAELLRASTLIIARTFQPLPIYLLAALIYWIINFLFGIIQMRLEKTSSRFVNSR
jgi:cystine transport system permease protein